MPTFCGSLGADSSPHAKLKPPTRSRPASPTLRVADVLRAHAAEYLASRGVRAAAIERRTLAQLTVCRTAALGGHAWACDTCGEVRVAYNSCRNRHCPMCGGPARARWLERIREDILPVPYFHLVFTLPHELSRLALANRRALYRLLFHSAWQALRQLAASPQHLGARIGALLVLHTWGQNLEHHPHVHCVVPGGGLSPNGTQWIASSPKFFLPVVALSRLFRGKFLDGLKRLHRAGKLKLEGGLAPLADAKGFSKWLAPLYEKDWVVYCQPPVCPKQGPEAVLKYLARYVAGAAISDARLLAHDADQVTFHAKNYRRGRKRQALTLSGVEFMRRFLLHVLPRGLPRIRYYGLLANAQRGTLLPRCRELLATAPAAALPATSQPGPAIGVVDAPTSRRCPACQTGCLLLIETIPRPRWRDLFPPPRTMGIQHAAHCAVAVPPKDSS